MFVEPHTEFAPAERASWELLYQQVAALNANSALQGVLNEATEKILILNAQRQVVYANTATFGALQLADPAEIYGCRFGEVLGCIHAEQGKGGCGTSKDCRFCSAINAALRSLNGHPELRKCCISRRDEAPPLDFVLNTMPVTVGELTLSLVMFASENSENSSKIAQNTFAIQRYAALIEQA